MFQNAPVDAIPVPLTQVTRTRPSVLMVDVLPGMARKRMLMVLTVHVKVSTAFLVAFSIYYPGLFQIQIYKSKQA